MMLFIVLLSPPLLFLLTLVADLVLNLKQASASADADTVRTAREAQLARRRAWTWGVFLALWLVTGLALKAGAQGFGVVLLTFALFLAPLACYVTPLVDRVPRRDR